MKILWMLVLVSQFAQAEPLKQSTLWADCVQSYKESKSVFFDVAYNENDSKNHIMFRNGKYMAPEGLSVFHDGQFWHSPIKIIDGFYEKMTALVIMGNEKFCMKQEFNWLRADKMTLVPFNEKTCVSTVTYELSPAQVEEKPNIEEILTKKLVNDVSMTLRCIDNKNPEAGCQSSDKDREYQGLLKWNTQACEKIDNQKIKDLIAEKKRVFSDYVSRIVPDKEPAALPTKKPGVKTKN